MAQTAIELIRELGERVGDIIVSTPSTSGTLTLVDNNLNQYFPQPINQFNGWIYGTDNVDPLNRKVERRAAQWVPNVSTLQLYPPGFPGPITVGQYEIHMRFPRKRKLAALNSAVAQLGLTWYRQIVDETITTQQSTWIYYPDPLQNWSNIYRIEIQINTSETQIGYPFAAAEYLNWRPRRWVDTLGKETWAIEFGILPPIDRNLRIFGEGFYPTLVNDNDVLAIAGKWEGGALERIYDWAELRPRRRDGLPVTRGLALPGRLSERSLRTRRLSGRRPVAEPGAWPTRPGPDRRHADGPRAWQVRRRGSRSVRREGLAGHPEIRRLQPVRERTRCRCSHGGRWPASLQRRGRRPHPVRHAVHRIKQRQLLLRARSALARDHLSGAAWGHGPSGVDRRRPAPAVTWLAGAPPACRRPDGHQHHGHLAALLGWAVGVADHGGQGSRAGHRDRHLRAQADHRLRRPGHRRGGQRGGRGDRHRPVGERARRGGAT